MPVWLREAEPLAERREGHPPVSTGYRAEVLTNPRYEADEQIEED
jgi:hypothetical protein